MLSKLDMLAAACAAFSRRGLAVHNDLCLHARHRKSDCRRCSSVCPTGAISFRDELVLSAEACSGCGACAAVCPTDALAALQPDDEEVRLRMLRHVKNSEAVAVACELHLEDHPEDRASVVAVPCIARLDVSLLVGAVIAGASSVTLLDAACTGCPLGHLRKRAVEVVDCVNHLLSRWRRPSKVAISWKLPVLKPLPATAEKAGGVSRRAFFAAFRGGKTAAAAAESVTFAAGRPEGQGVSVGFDGRPQIMPGRRQRLMDGLRGLGPAPCTEPFESPLWAEVSVSERCNGCGICAKVCPTGALAERDQGDCWTLSFHSASCTQCGLCAPVCYREALRLDRTVSIATVLSQVPRVLASRSKGEVDQLTETLDARFSRMFGCQVTS